MGLHAILVEIVENAQASLVTLPVVGLRAAQPVNKTRYKYKLIKVNKKLHFVRAQMFRRPLYYPSFRCSSGGPAEI